MEGHGDVEDQKEEAEKRRRGAALCGVTSRRKDRALIIDQAFLERISKVEIADGWVIGNKKATDREEAVFRSADCWGDRREQEFGPPARRKEAALFFGELLPTTEEFETAQVGETEGEQDLVTKRDDDHPP